MKGFWEPLSWRIKRQLKFWWQRRRRGFDDSELWSLDYTILHFILPRLRAFHASGTMGFPPEFLYGKQESEEETWQALEAFDALPEEERKRREEQAWQAWQDTIGKMIHSIELFLENDGIFLVRDENGKVDFNGALQAEFDEGWGLFHQYFFALWD